MTYYTALDVSLRSISICIVDDTGDVRYEAKVPAEIPWIVACLRRFSPDAKIVGFEAGALTQYLTIVVVVVTGVLLLVSAIAMQFTDEVSWGPGDFVVAGVLLFGGGMGMVIGWRQAKTIAARVAVVTCISVGLVVVWAELAVGLFS